MSEPSTHDDEQARTPAFLREPPWRNSLGTRDVVVSVVVAFNFAIAQPLLDVIGRHPEFFTARDAPRIDLVAFALAATVVAPLLLAGAVRLAYAAHHLVGFATHAVVVAWLLVAFALQALPPLQQPLSVGDGVIALGALVLAVAALNAFYESPRVRAFTRVGIIAPVAFAGLFLVVSPVQSLVLPAEAGEDAVDELRIGGPAPVVMVVFDELPLTTLMDADGGVDGELFPNFARLAEDATWFRNASTPYAYTSRALPALLTGSRPPADSEPIVDDHPVNLFSLLGRDYDVWAQEELTQLCPDEVCDPEGRRAPPGERWRGLLTDAGIVGLHTLLPEPLTGGLPPIDHAWGGFGEAPNPEESHEESAYDEFLAAFGAGERPGLRYYHSMLPHFPWKQFPSGQRYTDSNRTPGLLPTEDRGYVWREEHYPVAHSWQRHLLQAGEVDDLLGALLDRLEETGLDDEALLVVASDHGAAFQPGVMIRTTEEENVDEVAFVPLFVRRPGQETAEIVDEPVELLDVVPTVLDVLEAEPTPSFDGQSMFATQREPPERTVEAYDEVLEVPDDITGVEEAVARRIELFGEDGWDGVYRFGPRSDLLGATVAELPSAEDPPRVALDDEDRFDDVDPDGPSVPALITGELVASGDLTAPVASAVSVNGRVVATGETFQHDGPRGVISVLVPPSAYSRGENEVEVVPLADEG